MPTLVFPRSWGAILSLGVATANSVLVIAFAREQMQRGLDSVEAAYQAGRIRLRPVLMTMFVGMIPGPRRGRRRKTECCVRTRRYRRPERTYRFHPALRVDGIFARLRRNGPIRP